MKLRLALLAIILSLPACERAPAPIDREAEIRREEQIRALDDRLAQLQELERQAADRKLAEVEEKAAELERRASSSERRASMSEQEKQRLEKERQALIREREQLAEAQRKAEKKAAEAERKAAETSQRASQERQERTMDLFYTALEPHGEWLEVDRYGYVWHPNEASNPRWRPYVEGRWVFTEYGWTWKSNEPFGWATYHYGRWVRLRRIGWVWVPGTEWGPAWVSWRRSDRFVGWAPLPPEAWSGTGFNEAVDSYYDIGPGSYTFVPVDEIGQSTYVGRAVEPERNVTIINQTVNVTNVKYTTVQNNTVVYNGGPVFAEINAKIQQKVPQLNVERVADVRSSAELGRAEQRGNTLVMAAPRIAKNAEATRPQRVREQVIAPHIERGWTEVDKQTAETTRARITKEARDAEDRQRKAAAAGRPRQKQAAEPKTTPEVRPKKTAPPISPTPETEQTTEVPNTRPVAPAARNVDRETVEKKSQKATPAPRENLKKPAPSQVLRDEKPVRNPASGDVLVPFNREAKAEAPPLPTEEAPEQPAAKPAPAGSPNPAARNREKRSREELDAAVRSPMPVEKASEESKKQNEEKTRAGAVRQEPSGEPSANGKDVPAVPAPQSSNQEQGIPTVEPAQTELPSENPPVEASGLPAETAPLDKESAVNEAAAGAEAGAATPQGPERRVPRAKRVRPGRSDEESRKESRNQPESNSLADNPQQDRKREKKARNNASENDD